MRRSMRRRMSVPQEDMPNSEAQAKAVVIDPEKQLVLAQMLIGRKRETKKKEMSTKEMFFGTMIAMLILFAISKVMPNPVEQMAKESHAYAQRGFLVVKHGTSSMSRDVALKQSKIRRVEW